MTKKEAINELIALAVCIEPKLHCDDDCPYYKERGEDFFDGCNHYENFKVEEAVKILRGDKNV